MTHQHLSLSNVLETVLSHLKMSKVMILNELRTKN